MLDQIRRLGQRQMELKAVDDAAEDLQLLRSSAVSRKMQVQAAPTQLPAQIAQRLQFIGPDQNHERLGLLRQELQTIHLILELAARTDFGEMLSFVDQ
jgi:hypothetical protein